MKKFTCVQDIGDLKSALAEAFEIKKDRFKYVELGRNKTLMMIFFNSSLRTRLSTQKAAINLGMNVMVLDINQGAWKLETERGVIMDGDKPEHILEATLTIRKRLSINLSNTPDVPSFRWKRQHATHCRALPT